MFEKVIIKILPLDFCRLDLPSSIFNVVTNSDLFLWTLCFSQGACHCPELSSEDEIDLDPPAVLFLATARFLGSS